MADAETNDVVTHDEEETRALGARLGAVLQKGDIVLLRGDLGTGKTCLTQGIGRGLGVTGQVNSPSFVIENQYEGRETLFHVDLYRLEDVEELDDLGLWDYAERGVLVIEWPERGADLLPGDGLIVELRFGNGDRERRLAFSSRGERGAALVSAISVA